jgi:hypothetical protein
MRDLIKPLSAALARELPVTVLIDADATATVITVNPAAFPISKRQIASELAELISHWMETRAA